MPAINSPALPWPCVKVGLTSKPEPITVGTHFSGWESVCQSLKALGIDHTLEYACEINDACQSFILQNFEVRLHVCLFREHVGIRLFRLHVCIIPCIVSLACLGNMYAYDCLRLHVLRVSLVSVIHNSDKHVQVKKMYTEIKERAAEAAVNPRKWGDIDLYVAGSPCPSFSVAARKFAKGVKDPRGKLLYKALGFVAKTQPRAALLEQVANLCHQLPAIFKKLIKMLNKAEQHLKNK